MKQQRADAAPDSGFGETHPPPLPQVGQLAELMAALGATTVRAVIFDLDTRMCHESWQIDEHGESSNDSHVGGAISQFVTAMGTIAQLSETPATDTLIRSLNPRRCAFAWRIDDRRVAVAEARYRLPQTGLRQHDADLLREIFIVRMHQTSPDEPAAPFGTVQQMPHSAVHDDAVASAAGAPPATAVTARQRGAAWPGMRLAAGLSTGLGGGFAALMVFCLVAATLFLLADQQMQSLRDEQLRLQQQSDATLGRQVGDVLAQGDYGEVQAELDTFAELGYFQDALVTNAQRRVIALAGSVQDARIGNVVPATASGTAKVIELVGADDTELGELLAWGPPIATLQPSASTQSLLIAASMLSLAALVHAAWLLVRFRRRGALQPGAEPGPPEAVPPPTARR